MCNTFPADRSRWFDFTGDWSTGVRGLMMLTKITAKEMGVTDRTDAKQSIAGGSRYLKKLLKRLPDNIRGHDRLWQALASYNAGYGHVRDARLITKELGGDPSKWADVKSHLPKLQDPKWFNKAEYGYSRAARECIIYVRNIRRYYETLVVAKDPRKTPDSAPSDQSPQPRFTPTPEGESGVIIRTHKE